MTTWTTQDTQRGRDGAWVLALGGASLLAVFAAAAWTRGWALFSLLPPGGGVADVLPTQREDLHRTFFTIWASLLLAAPALALLPLASRSAVAARVWRICWTASLLVFAVHFYWAVVVIFGNDWQRVLNTPRVSAPRLDTVFALWWCVDVLLAWTVRPGALWVRVQRAGVHLLAFVLFFMEAAREGELPVSRALGWGFTAVVVLGLVAWAWRLRRPAGAR
ncbi:hypothetical protein [Hydrogenophaga electricum]|uniref:Uncharacterized protein n=1 Tax=Hydrogenophaga electricum TaxID=1230953 RepID=A0ABQ6C6U8_9BURK|nr:hypothetical protein [Hydrogenophaga electricum]GLS15849.1 hypothetical protein GCM10007935_32860 [Hydrogenophaga electricum]